MDYVITAVVSVLIGVIAGYLYRAKIQAQIDRTKAQAQQIIK